MKIFILGATGYIAGDLIYLINQTHPEYEITALVRNRDKGAQITAEYPHIRIVYGDNSSAEVIEEEVTKANVVFHSSYSADDVPSVQAISRALKAKPSDKPTYYIHTSGAGMITYEASKGEARFGKVYDDWDGLSEITSFPADAVHRNVDAIVLETGSAMPSVIKTAIVSPPAIYGPGRGPVNKSAMIAPYLVENTIKLGHGISGKPGFTWNQVHVQDLSALNLLLIEAAQAGGGNATWGNEGYYFVEAGERDWRDLARDTAQKLMKAGLTKDDEVEILSREEALERGGPSSAILYTTSRSRAIRARKLLAWEATHPTIEEVTTDAVNAKVSKA